MAYNTFLPFKIDCPNCGTRSEHSPQFGTAASYVYRDEETGDRCALRAYQFGDKLAWLPKSDSRYSLWREGSDRDYPDRDGAEEWLPVTCPDCLSKLLIVVGFESLYIVGVLDVVRADAAR